ncbi:MAG: DUF6716 putative glycosyltransferase [Propionicimonas sp.]
MTPAPNRRPARVAVLADTDSRWKWGMLTARQLVPADGVDPYLLERPEPPSARQLAEAGVAPDALVTVRMTGLAGVLARRRPDVLVLALPGGGTVSAVHALAAGWPAAARRPLLVTGYVGVVYEKVVEGLLARSGTDIVLANCTDDAERFRAVYAGLGLDPDVVVETSLPFLREAAPRERSGPFTVTFAGQPSVPASHADRSYLVRRLVQHARLHPGRVVNLKLRSVPGERVTHAEPHPYHALLRRAPGELPANLRITVGDMGEALAATDLLVTVSSTAALEAMSLWVPTVLLTDFGVRESLGNAYFSGSGCLASFDEVDAGATPAVDPAWARRHGVGGPGPGNLVDRVTALLETEPAPLRPYYTAERSPAYLPGLLASYGLGPDGRAARLGPSGDGQAARMVRKAIRSTARSFYRSGTHVVAPALRKLGSL